MSSEKSAALSLQTPLSEIKRIGPAYLKRLNKNLELKTLGDLIFHFPHRYEDFTHVRPVGEVTIGEVITIQGTITDIFLTRTWRRRVYLTEIEVQDSTGSIAALWYNQPYLAQTFKKGLLVSLSGKIVKEGRKKILQNPSYEIIRQDNQFLAHTARLVPVYPETKGVTSRWLRFQLKQFLPFIGQIKEYLPPKLLSKHKFITLSEALQEIHFPSSYEKLELAKHRLGFDEIFLIQLLLASRRESLKKQTAPVIAFEQKLIKNFVDSLPFRLSQAQRKAAWEILQDVARPHPMNRLLNGDVGTGKTLVAALAALQTAYQGFQIAFMVPTEVLAFQHFNTLVSLFKNYKFDLVLATSSNNKLFDSSTKKVIALPKKKIPEIVKMGSPKIVVGTHALISAHGGSAAGGQETLKFKNLALAIVDEQHRFGVAQRAQLVSGHPWTPHLLSMTATPIPRTLSLAIYGDLDISILDEMPKGIRKITTKIVLPQQAKQIYQFIEQKIKQGEQAFIICPRIAAPEGNEPRLSGGAGGTLFDKRKLLQLEMKAVETEHEKLKKIFSSFRIAKLHGRMKPQEKTETLEAMREGKTDMLVATSVIEVGIDIPKVSILWVENAERFGLAQLHQFRGRIGRAGQEAWCFLFTTKENSERLLAMVESNDGFKLAQKDLEIRGPGEFYGIAQWGFPELTLGSLSDYQTVKLARDDALEILKEDPDLKKYPALKEKFADFTKTIHLE